MFYCNQICPKIIGTLRDFEETPNLEINYFFQQTAPVNSGAKKNASNSSTLIKFQLIFVSVPAEFHQNDIMNTDSFE